MRFEHDNALLLCTGTTFLYILHILGYECMQKDRDRDIFWNLKKFEKISTTTTIFSHNFNRQYKFKELSTTFKKALYSLR